MTDLITPSHIPAGATPEGDGVITGDGPVRVDAFIDFLCPFCRRFELSAEPALADLIADGLISLAHHPMNFLDEASTTNYSTRAAAASGCAADQGRFLDYARALFLGQPPEGGPGLTYAELARIGHDIGLPDTSFASCITQAPYLDWPPFVTARATALGVQATPTVLVAGTAVQPDARAITAAVKQAAQPRLSASISSSSMSTFCVCMDVPFIHAAPPI
jgi:protein-disulfide isomerase